MSWIEQFPQLSSLERPDHELLLKNSSMIAVPENTLVFGPGKVPDHLLLLLEGTVRVQKLSDNGREIVLYRVRAGESCVMTSVCMLSFEKYSAEGITETDAKAITIPRQTFDSLVAASTAFRQFIFTAFSTRIMELFNVIEDVAFQRIDVRLAEKLLELAVGEDTVKLTHQQLAAELGTAREVISRQLSEFQRRGWVKLTRGAIEIVELPSLVTLSRG